MGSNSPLYRNNYLKCLIFPYERLNMSAVCWFSFLLSIIIHSECSCNKPLLLLLLGNDYILRMYPYNSKHDLFFKAYREFTSYTFTFLDIIILALGSTRLLCVSLISYTHSCIYSMKGNPCFSTFLHTFIYYPKDAFSHNTIDKNYQVKFKGS